MKAIPLVTVIVVTMSASGLAQNAPAGTTAAVVPGLTATPAHIPVGTRVGEPPSGYDDGGRRDPFVSLVVPRRTNAAQAPVGAPRTGLASLALADVVVSGIVGMGDTKLAILEGPNKKSFVTKVKARLADAVIVSIDSEGVVFAEIVEGNAPAPRIRRTLRPSPTAGEDLP